MSQLFAATSSVMSSKPVAAESIFGEPGLLSTCLLLLLLNNHYPWLYFFFLLRKESAIDLRKGGPEKCIPIEVCETFEEEVCEESNSKSMEVSAE